MKKNFGSISLLVYMLFFMTGCGAVGHKSSSLVIIYQMTMILSVLMFICYISLVKKKDLWLFMLFSSIMIVNTGYLFLAVSSTLNGALMANRLAYLGSVFLPLCMLMSILNTCNIKYSRVLPGILFVISGAVFLIAASPGILDIYYESVSVLQIQGVTTLQKVYGPWHCIYLYYLIAYFSAIIGVTIYSITRKKLANTIHTVMLACATFINIAVWLAEQMVHMDFEMLSISYIISEIFLLLLTLMLQENKLPSHELPAEPETPAHLIPDDKQQDLEIRSVYLRSQLPTLTPTERAVYEYYLEGKTTKEVLELLNIKENTLKYHNRNIYSKLGVTSKKQLIQAACYENMN